MPASFAFFPSCAAPFATYRRYPQRRSLGPRVACDPPAYAQVRTATLSAMGTIPHERATTSARSAPWRGRSRQITITVFETALSTSWGQHPPARGCRARSLPTSRRPLPIQPSSITSNHGGRADRSLAHKGLPYCSIARCCSPPRKCPDAESRDQCGSLTELTSASRSRRRGRPGSPEAPVSTVEDRFDALPCNAEAATGVRRLHAVARGR